MGEIATSSPFDLQKEFGHALQHLHAIQDAESHEAPSDSNTKHLRRQLSTMCESIDSVLEGQSYIALNDGQLDRPLEALKLRLDRDMEVQENLSRQVLQISDRLRSPSYDSKDVWRVCDNIIVQAESFQNMNSLLTGRLVKMPNAAIQDRQSLALPGPSSHLMKVTNLLQCLDANKAVQDRVQNHTNVIDTVCEYADIEVDERREKDSASAFLLRKVEHKMTIYHDPVAMVLGDVIAGQQAMAEVGQKMRDGGGWSTMGGNEESSCVSRVISLEGKSSKLRHGNTDHY